MVDRNKLMDAAVAAKASETKTGLPAKLTLAQWVFETGWGEHVPGNNCFGIKAYEGCHGVQELPSPEVVDGKPKIMLSKFATFATVQDCFDKHAELITTGARYHMAWSWFLKTGNVQRLIEDISHVYSTDPYYAIKIWSIARNMTVEVVLA